MSPRNPRPNLCWCPNHCYLQMRSYLEMRILQMESSPNKVTRVALPQYNGVCWEGSLETDSERTPVKTTGDAGGDGGRDWTPEAGRGRRILPGVFGGSQPCPHLNITRSASRTTKEHISVCGICSDSPGTMTPGFQFKYAEKWYFPFENNNEMLKMFSKTRVISTQPVWNWLFPAGLSDLFWLVPLKVKSPYEMLSKSHLTYAAPC